MSSLIRIAKTHEEAGFPEIPTELIRRRFWQYLNFLHCNALTSRIVSESLEKVEDSTEIRNFDLTERGFRFTQYSLGKWAARTYKDSGEPGEQKVLDRWLKEFDRLFDQFSP
jgi:hypothetical protein